jgi:polyphosphate kinase 2 (PPK2 family)
VKPAYKSKKEHPGFLKKHVEELSSLQHFHYASNRYALTLIFQAMEAAGYDGAIPNVMFSRRFFRATPLALIVALNSSGDDEVVRKEN